MILAMDENRVIGKDNKLPWHLPAELAYFKRVTMGHPIIMGRKTHESIGRPLPGRVNIVMTRDQEYEAEGVVIVHSVEETMSLLPGIMQTSQSAEAFVIGGAEVIRLFWPFADKLYITKIHYAFEGDTFFPEISEAEWKLVVKEKGITDEKNPYQYDYLIYERVYAP